MARRRHRPKRRLRRSESRLLGFASVGGLGVLAIGGSTALYHLLRDLAIGLGAVLCLALFLGCLWLIWKLRRQHEWQKMMRAANLPEIDQMTGTAFEQRLVVAFRDLGWRVKHVGCSGDFGCDLIASKGPQRLIVQAKRYSGQVGVEAVQEVHGALTYYGGTKARVITSSYFTPAARELAASLGVELWDRDRLVELMAEAASARGLQLEGSVA
jgi:restriction system protein